MTNLSRRQVLRLSGVTLALPCLESYGDTARPDEVKRFIAMQMPYGFLPNNLYPDPGTQGSSPYMSALEEVKGSVTLLDGLHNPGVNSGHDSNFYFLTCGRKDAGKNTISLDQELAAKYQGETRFKCLVSGIGPRAGMSYTRSGIKLPVQSDPAKVFARMFVGGSASDAKRKMHELSEGKSILDSYSFYATKFSGLSSSDRSRMDQYLTAVREVEKSLQASEAWINKPYPKVDKITLPNNKQSGEILNFRLFTKLFRLALENDSTRIITYDFGQLRSRLDIEGVSDGYHEISHHHNQKNKLSQLKAIELEMFTIYGEFLKELNDANLLDSTICLFGSAMESPNNHSAVKPPVLLAGGGFDHKWYMKLEKRQPLANLYLSLFDRMGNRTSSFGSSTGQFVL